MKKELRKQSLAARFDLPIEERLAKSSRIERLLFDLPEFRAARVVLFYASFRTEVETRGMIRRALDEGKRVVLPKVKGKELALYEIRDLDQDVAPGAWEIPEPVNGKPVDVRSVDIIIMPGAVFDEQGNRLGYGAGFYDRLLAGYQGATVALAFEVQVVPAVPSAKHDVPVKKIVTEKRVITAHSA